ncbi:hypothetical protein ABZY44_21295 [Streptomyces sp. NPDC006544]|uniref:hypothetical protein n=1 Tax=Streptomyces sp. NPDC006544 TaxID=3154583 RepID=UPI0033BDCA03
MPVKAWAAAGICLALLGGLAAWLLTGREAAAPCNGLPEDTGVRQSLGANLRPGMSCAAVGEAVVKATSGNEPGRHTQAQAQAMKNVLFALAFEHPRELALDPALRSPLANALADYAPDLHAMLAGLDSQYVLQAGRDAPPWEADGTYHLSVYTNVLRETVRAVAEDPAAYALLRMTETRTAAQHLVDVPADATGHAFTAPPTTNARAFGILDGIANAVTHGQDKDQAQKWRRTVMDRLLDEPATPKTYREDPAAYLTATWINDLKDTPDKDRPDRLRTQGIDMARTWTRERTTEEQTRQALLAEVDGSQLSAYREIKP